MIYFFLLLLHIFSETTAAQPAYTATDFILLDCGSSSITNDTSGRNWAGDEGSRYAASNSTVISLSFLAFRIDPSVISVPYKTARIFLVSPFRYNFPLSPGPKFLRLHFYPDIYSVFNTSQSFFSVFANDFTLLRNFNAFLHSQSLLNRAFMKEFVINLGENQSLDLIFSPDPNSFAFINGIEIVSIPDRLYFRGNDVPNKFANEIYYLKNDTTLENLYRLNVGGSSIEIQDDSGPTRGMYRTWSQDDDFIFGEDFGYSPHLEGMSIQYTSETPPYSAPPKVYSSARVTTNTSISLEWAFPVDSGFYYLLRLHFCEFTHEVRVQNQRVFTIYVNNEVADLAVDVILMAGGADRPIFRDYVTWVPDDGHRGKKNIRLSLVPAVETQPVYQSALLNGLEIFKLSDETRTLASANPDLRTDSSTPAKITLKKKKVGVYWVVYTVAGSVIGVLILVAFVFLIFRRWRVQNSVTATKSWIPFSSTTSSSTTNSSLDSNICRHFSLQDIKTATYNFNNDLIIGKGGFGDVYKGLIDNGTITAAIKRLSQFSSQGAHEFQTEIRMLSKVRHPNLVSLIGYCDADGEMILIYEYMAQGTLRSHLYNSENSPLSWKQRLQICLDAAKGLLHLHTCAIIHRDVKSTNILLGANWVAKISDFGLSKMGQSNDSFTHVSTNVKGTFGYLDPKYLSTHHLTRKSDVYAFGVVLFEVLSGRPAVDVSLEEEQINLAGWARDCVREREVERLIDHKLLGQISGGCLQVYVGIAGRCVHIQPLERPTMADVVMGLELALSLQQKIDSVEDGDNAGIVYSDRRQADDTIDSKEESDQIII